MPVEVLKLSIFAPDNPGCGRATNRFEILHFAKPLVPNMMKKLLNVALLWVLISPAQATQNHNKGKF